jgi:hypothetical protein
MRNKPSATTATTTEHNTENGAQTGEPADAT